MQYFKGDVTELKFYNSSEPTLNQLSVDKDEFEENAYTVSDLGELIFDTKRAPLTNAISRDIFRLAFKEIFEAFVKVGTFEAYLTVFNKIFGEEVDVNFVVPAPGRLQINIVSNGIELSNFVSRYIYDNAYLFDQIIDFSNNEIVFQTIKGFTSQYELEQMLFEMVPAGIFTEISLTLGV